MVACARQERGERVRMRVQVSEGKWASSVRLLKGLRARERGRRTRGRGRVHGEGRGREVGDGLTGGVHGTERERTRMREERRRQIGPTEQRER
jgi:hypothetical protein